MWDRKKSEQGTTNKEQILAKLRNAIIEKPEALFEDIDLQSDTWNPIKEEDGNAITFVQRFKNMGGIFIYLENEAELGECLKQLAPQNDWEPIWCKHPKTQALLDAYSIPYLATEPDKTERSKTVSLVPAETLVAQTGSILITEGQAGGRRICSEADVLLVIAHTTQIVGSIKEALLDLKENTNSTQGNQTLMITGSSISYDIEQELVQGVFGPRQIAVFLVDE